MQALAWLFANIPTAHAQWQAGQGQPVPISTGVNSSVPQLINGIVNVLLAWASLVATALFVLGAFMMVMSGGQETTLANGKKIMKAALIGYAIILASWMILSTVVFFIVGF